ncbi:hypothetical protein ERJ75_001061000 [Trypanosoma vivax]|nr:hypothetical protein ERJ75_001061000 [Trypanosoma vivax]
MRPARVQKRKRSRSQEDRKTLEKRKAHVTRRAQRPRKNKRLHRATRDAFAAGEWGTTARRAMRRWLASRVGSRKARSSPGNNELRGRYGIGFRRRGKKTTLQSSLAGCTARCQERQPATAGEAARSFGKQAAALGNAAPAPKPPKAYANDAGIIKATDRDPCLLAWVSEAGRVAKRMRTGPAWAQRMPIMRRLGEFAKAHGPEMSQGNAPLFIVSLKPARSSAVQRTRAPLSPMAAGEAPAQMLPSGLRGAAAENPTRRTRPMMRWEPHRVCNAMVSERGRVAVRLAWVTASRCDEIALLQKENFVEHPSNRNALVVDLGALPKTFEAKTRRAARCVAIAGADAAMVRKVVAKTVAWERLAALGAQALKNTFWPDGVAAYSIKRGAPAHAAAAAVEHDLGPRAPTQLGKHAGPPGLPRGTARCPGHWAAVLNSSAKLTALMRRARRAWSNCLVRPQGPRAKVRRQGHFLMGAAFWDAFGLPERPPRRNNGDCHCRK